MLGGPGGETVAAMLPNARIGAVNLAEVVAKLQERGVPDNEIDRSLADLDLDVIPFDREQALVSGKLRVKTRSAGLSHGDRACLALAVVLNAAAVTTDRGWAELDVGVQLIIARA